MRSVYLRGLPPLLLLLIGAAWASTSAPAGAERLSGAEIYRRTLQATAWVHARDSGKGTGWVLDRSRRLLVTCAHVVGDNKSVDVVFPVRRDGAVVADRGWYYEHMADLRSSGDAVRGKVLRCDRGTDLALVELESLPPGAGELRLADEGARPGDRVHVVGCRYDVDSLWAHSGGAVRQVRVLREGYFSAGKELAKGARVVTASAPINEGDSGGPLVNERGEVVGVVAAVDWQAQGAGLFIDVAEVRALAKLPAPLPDKPAPAVPVGPSAPRDVYQRGLRSLALVRTEGDKRWSGFLLDRPRRLLLTTAEAVGKRETVEVIFPVSRDGRVVAEAEAYRDRASLQREKGALTTGTVLATDARRNLALLELAALPEDTAEVRFASDGPAPGDALHALGNPNRMDVLWVYTACGVRQLGRVNLGQTAEGPDPAVLVVQAPLTEGEGGGPLFDDHGDLVGVVSGKTGPQQQVAYCLTAGEVKAFLDDNRLRWEPETAAALCSRGAVFTKARQYDRAIADFDAALSLDPKYAPAYGERGKAYFQTGDDDKAVRDCGRAIDQDPKLTAAWCWRAAARCRQGDRKKALADCDAALASDPHSALALAVRGDVRRLLGDRDGALTDCNEALWLDRQLPAAHLYRGQVFAEKGNHDAALADFTRAVQLDPLLAEAYRLRGDSYWFKSDSKAALADYDQALTLTPRDPAALHGRGRALAARGEHELALAAFDGALAVDPRRAAVYLDRGGERLQGGDRDKGLADYVEAVRREPALAADVLTAVERRGEKATPAECCELCRRTLTALRPLFKEKPEVQKAIDAGLAAAEGETDLERRAMKLRATVAEVRSQAGER